METWRKMLYADGTPIKSRKNRTYYVSDLGRVKSVSQTGKKRVLVPSKNDEGYLHITVQGWYNRHTIYVHRAVVQAFLDSGMSSLKDVTHANGNITDNRLCNLLVADRNETRGVRKRVRCLETGNEYRSAAEAERILHLPKGYVARSARKGRKTMAFQFRYL